MIAGTRVVTGREAVLAATGGHPFFPAYDYVALGVMSDNSRAVGLYARLGFTAALDLSAVEPAVTGRRAEDHY